MRFNEPDPLGFKPLDTKSAPLSQTRKRMWRKKTKEGLINSRFRSAIRS